MKTMFVKSLLVFALVGFVATSCNRNAEKKIAQLESELADLKSKNATTSITPTAAPAGLVDPGAG